MGCGVLGFLGGYFVVHVFDGVSVYAEVVCEGLDGDAFVGAGVVECFAELSFAGFVVADCLLVVFVVASHV